MKRLLAFVLIFSCLFFGENAVYALQTSAKAAVIINIDTQEVIWEHNAKERLPMASTTKIMTALLLCESGQFERQIVVTPQMVAVEGSSMGLLAGDSVTMKDLLYGLMLASGNDAANTVATVLGGSVEGFAQMMNDKAKALGLENTHFVTPSGLDSEQHYTTAFDLARLAAEALKNEEFADAVSTKSATLCYGNPPYRRTLTNHNRLLKMYDDVVGVKTGFTKKSGRCLVSAAEKDGKRVIAVTLSDPNDWQDHRSMLDYGLSSVKNVSVENIDLSCKAEGIDDPIELYSENRSFCIMAEDEIETKTVISPMIFAPIYEGEKVGVTVIYNKNGVIDTVPISVKDTIKSPEVDKKETFWMIFKSILRNVT